jgi:hypothetical protein
VRGPREAVDAAVLAASVGVDGEIERNVGRVVARQDAARGLLDDLRARCGALLQRRLRQRPPAVVEALAVKALEAGSQVVRCPAALEGHEPQGGDVRVGRRKGGTHTVCLYSTRTALHRVQTRRGHRATALRGPPQ